MGAPEAIYPCWEANCPWFLHKIVYKRIDQWQKTLKNGKKCPWLWHAYFPACSHVFTYYEHITSSWHACMHVNDVWVKMYSEFQQFYGPIFTLKHAFSGKLSTSTTQTTLQQSATPNQNWGMLVFNARGNPIIFFAIFLSSLSHLKLTSSKVVVPPRIDPGTPRTPIPWTPMPSHTCDAARTAIPYLYMPCIDDIVGLRPIFTFPSVVFCEIQWG